MPNIGITTFNAGELSPHLAERSDVEKYASGCRILENMLPLVYGDVVRRPGTKYVSTAKTASIRLVPFIYSSDIAYVCEFGQNYIRFYYGGAALLDGAGLPVEVATSYASSDLPQLQFRQIGDTMWIVHSSYAPRKLTRTSATSFALAEIEFSSGPFDTRNDVDLVHGHSGISLTSSVYASGATGTLTASGGPSFQFVSGHIGALFKLTVANSNMTVTQTSAGISSEIRVNGTFSFNILDTWSSGPIILERNENNTGWDAYRTYTGLVPISLSATENESNVKYRINSSGASSCNATIAVDNSSIDGIVKVTSWTSASQVGITVVSELDPTNGTKPTLRWSEGSWSSVSGWPSTIAFFGDRAIYAGSTSSPQTVWLSKVSDYENFDDGVTDSDSFSLTLTMTDRIRWVEALETLLVGTSGGLWRIESNKLGQPITPTNFTIRQQSTFGSSDIQAQRVNSCILFADRVGRKLREATYQYNQDKYVSPDLLQLAEHITSGPIVSMAHQKNPDSILWITLDDGVLASMVYDRDDNVVAWSRHPMDNDGINEHDGDVTSVAVIPGVDEDEVWVSVKRYIGSGYVTFVEQMQSRLATDQADGFYVDCGVLGSGTTVSIPHLEGRTVSILADGAVLADQVVSGGVVTLAESATVANVGLPYRWTVQPMRIQVASRQGSSQGSYISIKEASISLLNSGIGAQYGLSYSDLYDLIDRSTEPYGTPPRLFTGEFVANFAGGFDPQTPIMITGNSPLPCTLRAIIVRADNTGR